MGMGYGRMRSHEDIERIDNLKQQRDQLREALELVLFCDKEDTVHARTKARAALKAAED